MYHSLCNQFNPIFSLRPRPCMCSGPNTETSLFPSENTEPMSLKVSGQTPLESALSFPGLFSNALFDHIPGNLSVSTLLSSTYHLRRSPLPSHWLPLCPGKGLTSVGTRLLLVLQRTVVIPSQVGHTLVQALQVRTFMKVKVN